MKYIVRLFGNEDLYLMRNNLWGSKFQACRFKKESRARSKGKYHTFSFHIIPVANNKPRPKLSKEFKKWLTALPSKNHKGT